MAFNIFERWPWTSFQNLNLDWLMQAAKEALTKATEASESVGTFDARITQNTNAIEAMSSPARVVVDDALHVTYNGSAVTGEELLTMMRTHGDLPYVEYMSEVYMLDTVRYDNALRFSMCHTYDSPDRLVMRHITIPANSSDAAYSITSEQGGSGGDSNTLVFNITDNTCDHTYAQLLAAWNAGKALIARIATSYISQTSAMVFKETVQMSGGGTKDRFTIIDPAYLAANRSSIFGRYVYDDGSVSYGYIHNILVTFDMLLENAVSYANPQELTAAQQAQARENIGAVGAPYQIPINVSGGVYSTTATGSVIYDNRASCYAEINGVTYYPIGGNTSGPYGHIYLAAIDPTGETREDVEILDFLLNNTDPATVTKYSRDILYNGAQPYLPINASAAVIPPLPVNTLVEFMGEASALNITLAQPTDNNITNEYHFIFTSGATPTTLTLPSTIRQPDGFTVEANHVYEVSILEDNMTAQGWAVTP